MLTYPTINPIAIKIGPIKVHWYGIMYLVGFALAWWLGNRRAKASNGAWTAEHISDLIFYGALGAVLGGRIGYTFFYGFNQFINDPVMIFRVWEGGMSFHGGFLGVMAAMLLYARRYRRRFFDVMDFLAPLAPLGLAAGRIGNFINGELWGRPTDVPWAMVFPTGGPLPRHPSQLYEFFLEGIVLFSLVWWFSSKPRPRMAVSGLFSLCYGAFRFGVEFVRQPDEHLQFIAFNWLTMGQLLSTPMILLGAVLLWWAYNRNDADPPEPQNNAKNPANKKQSKRAA